MWSFLTKPAKSLGEKLLNIAVTAMLSLANIIIINLVFASLGVLPMIQFHEFVMPSAISLIFAVVLAPLWEELAFRHIPIKIAGIFSEKLILPVVLLSSILFGWGHGMGTISLLVQGVGGFILSLVYIKNGNSYWSAVAVHAIWNFIAMSFLG